MLSGGGKSADDVRRYYELLVHDIARIEAGKVPFPAYRPPCPRTGHNASYEADRYDRHHCVYYQLFMGLSWS